MEVGTDGMDNSRAPSGVALVACASDPKQSDLPVTVPCPRRVQIINAGGAFVRWVDDAGGRELLKTRRAEALYTKRGRLRALRLLDDAELIRAGSNPRTTHYSHDRETAHNVRGCWMLVRIPSGHRDIFCSVAIDCSVSRAA